MSDDTLEFVQITPDRLGELFLLCIRQDMDERFRVMARTLLWAMPLDILERMDKKLERMFRRHPSSYGNWYYFHVAVKRHIVQCVGFGKDINVPTKEDEE